MPSQLPAPEPGVLPGRVWLKVGAAFGLAAGIALLLPRDGGGTEPPVGTLLLAAVLVTAVTTVALWLGVRSDLGLPARVALYAVGWNALVVLVKLVLGPLGMYEVNRVEAFDTFAPDNLIEASFAAAFVFALYLAGYVVVYRLVRRRLAVERRPRRVWALTTGIAVGALAVSTLGVGLIAVLVLSPGFQYVDFVASSSVGVLVGVALAVATGLAAVAFRDVGRRSQLVGDAAVLTTFFWLGLAFLALHHALWVVYVLVLTATWPLRVVIPK